jgi:hypothetical protein
MFSLVEEVRDTFESIAKLSRCFNRVISVKNEIKLTEDDVNVLNEKGNKVYYIKAPGNYTIHFSRISVLQDFGHLSGELGVTLQVPLLEGPAGEEDISGDNP